MERSTSDPGRPGGASRAPNLPAHPYMPRPPGPQSGPGYPVAPRPMPNAGRPGTAPGPLQAPPALGAGAPVPTLSAVPTASPAPLRQARRSGPSAFTVAFVFGALVAVGGISYAVGRWSAPGGAGSVSGSSVTPGAFAAETLARVTAGEDGSDLPIGGRRASGVDATGTTGVVDDPSSGGDAAGVQTPLADEESEAGLAGPLGQFARGGTEGSLSAITPEGLSLETSQGDLLSVATVEITSYVQESPIEANSLTTGEIIRVQLRSTSSAEADTGSNMADLVTVLASDDVLSSGGASGPGSGPAAGRGLRDLGADPSGTGDSPPARGLGRLLAQGRLAALTDEGIMLESADGQSRLLTTDANTRFVRETAIERDALKFGDRVRLQLLPQGFGPGADVGAGGPAAGEGSVALKVTLLPAGEAWSGVTTPM